MGGFPLNTFLQVVFTLKCNSVINLWDQLAHMNCPACGNPLESQSHFCPKCFAPIEVPGFWRKLLSLFQAKTKASRPILSIKKTVTIKSTDKDGQQHEYHSFDELPPELAAEVKKLEGEALKQVATDSISDGLTTRITTRKSVSVFRVKDASGKEQVYHSLEEMPPELRSLVERARNQIKE
jgi:hypothetical protein